MRPDLDEAKAILHEAEMNKILHQVEESFKEELDRSQIEKIKSILSTTLRPYSDVESFTAKIKPTTSFNLSSDKGRIRINQTPPTTCT